MLDCPMLKEVSVGDGGLKGLNMKDCDAVLKSAC